MTEPLLQLQSVRKYFDEDQVRLHVLTDIELHVKPGEFLVLLGPSGSGKSTLLRIMAGLIKPSSGEIKKTPNLKQGFVFQNFALFPWLSVIENAAFGLHMRGQRGLELTKRVGAEIERMGLKGFGNSFPRQLSGGMKQRVGIARALAVDPDILFLDEPFSALDSFTAKRLRVELLDLWQERKFTAVVVTHLIEEALQLGDRIVVLSQRPAKILGIIHNPLPRPRDVRSKEFFELMDHIDSMLDQSA